MLGWLKKERRIDGWTASDKTFTHERVDGPTVIENVRFERCLFERCSIGAISTDRKRTVVVRNAEAIDCRYSHHTMLRECVIDTALVDGLQRAPNGPPLLCYGPLFRHVVLRGEIDSIVTVFGSLGGGWTERRQHRAFTKEVETFYASIDWALDISEAEFRDTGIRGIPARLIRRDPETQKVVTRETLRAGRWRDVVPPRTFEASLQVALQEGWEDYILIACKRGRNFSKQMEALRILEAEGIVQS